MAQKDDDLGLFTCIPEAPPYPAQEKYQAHLLDQYKLYVEMADRVSSRRLSTNSYFLSINSAILAFLGYVTSKNSNEYLCLLGISGIPISILWFFSITSYRDLNTAKFKVIHQIEKQLPLSLYYAEWNAMGCGKNPALYRPLSHIERIVPWVFFVLHLYVFIRTFPWHKIFSYFSICFQFIKN